MLTRNEVGRRSQWLLRCAIVLAVGAVGCANDVFEPEVDAKGEVKSHEAALQQETSGGTSLNNGVFFADVRANGTGCPEGSWTTSISPDGKVFTTTFSQYEVAVDQNKDLDFKACQITVKLRSPSGLSYAVSNFSYSGYAFLDPNVSVSLAARYYFQGVNVGPDSSTKTLTGPLDQPYLFEDRVETNDFVWSPCGADRELNIPTRLRMINSSPRGAGYTNLAALDARTEGKIIFQLNWRECK
jgi:hypothetical protein